MVAQYIPSGYTGGINISGDLDPEMMIISPVEQAVNSVRFYNNNNDGIYAHYVTVIVPKVGLGSLRIDGGSAFDYSVVHPQNSDYQIVVKRWSQPGTHTVVCDTTFNAITYGMGVAESYGYNAGTNINNLNAKLQLNNSSESVAASYTCDGTDFKFSLKTTYKLAKLDLQLDTINNLLPKENIVIDNPVSTGTIIENDRTYNVYAIDKMFKFTKTGIYNVVAKLTAPEIEGCNFTEEIVIPIEVKEMPELDLSANPTSICSGNSITLNATASDVKSYSWAVGTSSYTTANPQHTFATIGEQKVKLNTIRASDGCMAADSITVKVNALPTAAFSLPDAICFPNGAAVFTNTSSFTNGDVNALTYNWNFGDGTTSATKDGNHVYSAIQNYTVRLTATSTDGCQSATTYTLPSDRFIAQLLSSTNFTDSTLCANNLIDFKGSANRTLTNAE